MLAMYMGGRGKRKVQALATFEFETRLKSETLSQNKRLLAVCFFASSVFENFQGRLREAVLWSLLAHFYLTAM